MCIHVSWTSALASSHWHIHFCPQGVSMVAPTSSSQGCCHGWGRTSSPLGEQSPLTPRSLCWLRLLPRTASWVSFRTCTRSPWMILRQSCWTPRLRIRTWRMSKWIEKGYSEWVLCIEETEFGSGLAILQGNVYKPALKYAVLFTVHAFFLCSYCMLVILLILCQCSVFSYHSGCKVI